MPPAGTVASAGGYLFMVVATTIGPVVDRMAEPIKWAGYLVAFAVLWTAFVFALMVLVGVYGHEPGAVLFEAGCLITEESVNGNDGWRSLWSCD